MRAERVQSASARAEACDRALALSIRRIGRWPAPPNWCHCEWMEEICAQVICAALEAQHDFQPWRGIPLEAFLHHRILAAALAYYRREWAYARHCRHISNDSGPRTPSIADDSPAPEIPVAQLLEELSPPDCRLIRQCYFDSCTEADIARQEGVSQQAVSKRKGRILRQLRSRCAAL